MGKVIFAINITIDGYCGHESGIPDDETMQYFTQLLQETDAEIMGRKTYDLMYPYWHEVGVAQSGSDSENEFALAFDALQKIVFSKTLERAEWVNATLRREGLREEVLKWKEQPGKVVSIGGLDLGSQVARWGLIDEYRFVVHPVIAGQGPRLFEDGGVHALKLVETRTFRSGIVALHYQKTS
ncbi:MAG: dihydrofolate reductase family protein [Anaerolineales bacterium]|nr:dihydrofolate reductase family protein [Anaerolineales bacterium]